MWHAEKAITPTLLLILGLAFIHQLPLQISTYSSTDNLVIKGLVQNSLNLSYSEVETLPMISEIAQLQCVYAADGTPYNWTGVPIFYLLHLAKVQPEAKDVVFRAEDGLSSSLTIDEAMHPTTMLSLKVNGTTLSYEDGYWTSALAGGYPYKLVVPCRWGYKWVGWIDEIEVVSYDYKGFYESRGFSDEASIPNCTRLPATEPAYALFNATWRETYTVTVFTNAALLEAVFNPVTKQIHLIISSNNNSDSLIQVIIPKRLLTTNFTVLSDKIETHHNTIQSETNSFVYFTLSQGLHSIKIQGMLLADVTGQKEGIPDGKVDMRDVGSVAKCFGTEVENPSYIENYDINSDGKIDMKDIGIAAKDFGKILP